MDEDFFLSNGQITFAICFFLAFVIIIAWAFKKDTENQPKYAKGTIKVIIAILAVAASIVLLSRALN